MIVFVLINNQWLWLSLIWPGREWEKLARQDVDLTYLCICEVIITKAGLDQRIEKWSPQMTYLYSQVSAYRAGLDRMHLHCWHVSVSLWTVDHKHLGDQKYLMQNFRKTTKRMEQGSPQACQRSAKIERKSVPIENLHHYELCKDKKETWAVLQYLEGQAPYSLQPTHPSSSIAVEADGPVSLSFLPCSVQ